MIAADTSTWIAFLQGDVGEDVALLEHALRDRQVLMVPAVLAELFSDPKLSPGVADKLVQLPMIEIQDGYWRRSGALRARASAKGRKARLGDALIAQTCIDRSVPLLTRDRDFKAFAHAAELDLLI